MQKFASLFRKSRERGTVTWCYSKHIMLTVPKICIKQLDLVEIWK